MRAKGKHDHTHKGLALHLVVPEREGHGIWDPQSEWSLSSSKKKKKSKTIEPIYYKELTLRSVAVDRLGFYRVCLRVCFSVCLHRAQGDGLAVRTGARPVCHCASPFRGTVGQWLCVLILPG